MNLIVSRTFEDIFGNTTTYYKSNAGDKIKATYLINIGIVFKSSDDNQINVSLNPNELTRTSGNWEDDGWRVGDSYEMLRYQSNGTPDWNYVVTGTVSYINGNTIGITNFYPSMFNGQSMDGTQPLLIASTRAHDGLTIFLNHVLNTTGGSSQSLIDGEETKIVLNGLDALAVSGSIIGTQVGNKSGSFNCSAQITRLANPIVGYRQYEIEIEIINPGVLDSEWFLGSSCLKLYNVFKWQSLIGEPYATQDLIDDILADTGYLDEAFNADNVNSSLIQGIQAIDWANATSGSFIVDSTIPEFYVCGMYVPLDETYYKNKPQSQSNLCMMLDSHSPATATTYGSFSNPVGASWNFVLAPPTISGTQRTYPFVFIPDVDFQSFFDAREEGDRRFVIWFRAGNTNHVLFDGQLTKEMPPAGPLPNVDTFTMIKHNDNTEDANGIDPIFSPNRFNYTEDDLAFITKMIWDKGHVYTALRVKMIARHVSNGSEFVLQQTSFDLTGVQISSDGRQLLNLSVGQQNNLPTTSSKKNAKLELYPSLDTVSQYGVKLYYPYLNDWRYWEPLSGVDADFYPDQNKNWYPYSNDPNWNVYVKVELDDDQGEYNDEYLTLLITYNGGNTTASIEYYRPDGTQVLALVDGEVMTIKIKHSTLTVLNPTSIWAIASVEPFESGPVWYTSSVIAQDGNQLNPLGPLSISVSGTITTLEFTLDTNKINGTNGVSISSRIFGNDIFVDRWLTTGGDLFETTSGDNWLIE